MQTGFLKMFAAVAVLLAIGGARAEEGDRQFSRVERGLYLVRAADCAACHTDKEGQPFAGGRAIPTPFGTIYSTNITPDKETGIGNWSEEDFWHAMHDGMRRDGEHLYPAMPYPAYTKLSRDDVDAIKTYLDTVKPVKSETRSPDLPWPLSWRGGMAVWNEMFFTPGVYQTNPHKSAQWNRGAYLVLGAGHCEACHTPRNFAGAKKSDDRLAGGDAGEHWYAPELTGGLREGLGNWSEQDIVTFLKTGATKNTAAAGPMAEVVENSTRYLSDGDLKAIAVYLKDLPADAESGKQDRNRNIDSRRMLTGAALYQDNCAGCHMQNGQGLPNVFPSLKASSMVQSKKPDAIMHLVLTGAKRPGTPERPAQFAMPSFKGKLNDAQIADLVTYVRNAWGNDAAAVDADSVKSIRKDLSK